MGFVDSSVQRHRIALLFLAGGLALLIALLLNFATQPEIVAAQISPLSPLPVATPRPVATPQPVATLLSQGQPQVIQTDTPSPLASPQSNTGQSSATVQNPSANRNFVQSPLGQPLAPLGEPTQAQVSLILVGALLVGLGLLVVVVLVVRRRE